MVLIILVVNGAVREETAGTRVPDRDGKEAVGSRWRSRWNCAIVRSLRNHFGFRPFPTDQTGWDAPRIPPWDRNIPSPGLAEWPRRVKFKVLEQAEEPAQDRDAGLRVRVSGPVDGLAEHRTCQSGPPEGHRIAVQVHAAVCPHAWKATSRGCPQTYVQTWIQSPSVSVSIPVAAPRLCRWMCVQGEVPHRVARAAHLLAGAMAQAATGSASGLPQVVVAAWHSEFGRGMRADPEMVR